MKHKIVMSLLLMLGLCGVSYAQTLKCDAKEVQEKLLELGDEILKEYHDEAGFKISGVLQARAYYDLIKEEPQNRVIEFNDFKIYSTRSPAAKKDGTQLLCRVNTILYHKDQPENKHTKVTKYTIEKTNDGIEVKLGLPLGVI